MDIPTRVEGAGVLCSLVVNTTMFLVFSSSPGLTEGPGLVCRGNKVWRSEETGDHDIRHASV